MNADTLIVRTTSSSGGGKYGRPGYVNLVELAPGTEFVSVKAKNVVAVHERVSVDTKHTGPRSHYAAQVARLQARRDAMLSA